MSWLEKYAKEFPNATIEDVVEHIYGQSEITWFNEKKIRPERNKYVLGYDYYGQTYAVVSWDGVDWTDDNGICYDVTHWTELPKVII